MVQAKPRSLAHMVADLRRDLAVFERDNKAIREMLTQRGLRRLLAELRELR